MKRHPSLRKFSDDHHQGLVNARRLRRAASGEGASSAANTARDFLEFWQRDTSLHFRKEEEVLLPVLARYGGDVGERPLLQMLTQHARIRGLAMQLSDEIKQDNIQEVVSRLEIFEPGPPHEPWVPVEGFSFDPWPGPGDSEGGGSD